jgi:hypothetical protein
MENNAVLPVAISLLNVAACGKLSILYRRFTIDGRATCY